MHIRRSDTGFFLYSDTEVCYKAQLRIAHNEFIEGCTCPEYVK